MSNDPLDGLHLFQFSINLDDLVTRLNPNGADLHKKDQSGPQRRSAVHFIITLT